MRYLTTNIRIEADVLKELKHRAVEEGRRMAELVREAVDEYLRETKEKTVIRRRKKEPK